MADASHLTDVDRALARRPRRVVEMPARDERIESLALELRRAVSDTWQRRAHEELKVAAAFSVLCRELLETGADADAVAVAARAVSDEVRHGEICRTLASCYRGEEVPWPPAVAIDPHPAREDHLVRTALHVTSMCCVNEAIASTFLETSFAGATGLCARAALRELLQDEVEHARLGWLYVARAVRTPMLHEAVQANMLRLVDNCVACWLDCSAITLRDGMPDDGLPSVAVTRACALTAVRELVLPGFEQVGLDVRETRTWLATLAA
jgi:hypothetical protein